MTTINESYVSKALIDHLMSIPNLPHIVTENTAYTPVIGTPYLREMDIPAITQAPTLNTTGYQRRDGAYRIGLFYPKSTGKFQALAIADKIISRFYRGLRLEYEEQTVEIKTTDREQIYTDGEFIQCGLMIRYTVVVN